MNITKNPKERWPGRHKAIDIMKPKQETNKIQYGQIPTPNLVIYKNSNQGPLITISFEPGGLFLFDLTQKGNKKVKAYFDLHPSFHKS